MDSWLEREAHLSPYITSIHPVTWLNDHVLQKLSCFQSIANIPNVPKTFFPKALVSLLVEYRCFIGQALCNVQALFGIFLCTCIHADVLNLQEKLFPNFSKAKSKATLTQRIFNANLMLKGPPLIKPNPKIVELAYECARNTMSLSSQCSNKLPQI